MQSIHLISTKYNIVKILRNKILTGKIKNNTVLAQENIAEQLGVSRMPVREAFVELEQEGLLERMPNRRVKVTSMNKKQMIQNIRVLAALEKELSIMIMQEDNLVYKLIGFFKSTELYTLSGNKSIYVEEVINFHKLISQLLGNNYLCQIHSRLVNSYLSFILSKNNINWKRQNSILGEILKCIKQKNSNCIQSLFDEYFDDIRKLIEED